MAVIAGDLFLRRFEFCWPASGDKTCVRLLQLFASRRQPVRYCRRSHVPARLRVFHSLRSLPITRVEGNPSGNAARAVSGVQKASATGLRSVRSCRFCELVANRDCFGRSRIVLRCYFKLMLSNFPRFALVSTRLGRRLFSIPTVPLMASGLLK